MRPAIIVVDMLKDNFKEQSSESILSRRKRDHTQSSETLKRRVEKEDSPSSLPATVFWREISFLEAG